MTRTKFALGVLAVGALAGTLAWWLRAPADPPPATSADATAAAAPALSSPVPTAHEPAPAPVMPRAPTRPPAATDPRLAALLGTPGDALVEYKTAPDGRVIQEIDRDPNSQGYLKPLREYQYAGDRLAVVTVYKYLGTQLQVTRATASYKPDGTVDKYAESTEYRKP